MPRYSDLESFLAAVQKIDETAPEKADQASFVAESSRLDLDAREVDLEHRREEVRSKKQDREERKKYAQHIFLLCCGWLFAVIGLVLLQGFGGAVSLGPPPCLGEFSLSNTVLATLVGSTTASVVAIFAIVARHLFPRRDSN